MSNATYVQEYRLQYRLDGVWSDWGYRTTSLDEMLTKMDEARRTLNTKVESSGIKLRYVMRLRRI